MCIRDRAETVGFVDGGMYALPAVTTGPIFFYNKTIYDEMGFTPPTTWEELAEQSKAIYEKYGIPGFAADSLTDLMPVSYTHLDVYKRQDLFRQLCHVFTSAPRGS